MNEPRPAPPLASRRHVLRARGFTLIELLVVIVIIGVLVGAVTLAVGGSSARELQNTAERTRALIALACERATIGGRDIGFVALRDDLRFGYYEADGWREMQANASDDLRARPWGDGIEVRAERDGEALLLDDELPREPPFACLSSGELTPLRIEFERADVDDIWHLEGRLDGRVSLLAVPRER